ncbi:hypothetical protein SAMN06275492_1591, partial [Dethiosulfovibrio salsuginis]
MPGVSAVSVLSIKEFEWLREVDSLALANA